MLKAYFDKSGSEDSGFLTLTGIAAKNETWGEIERTWSYMLSANSPKASYMHMVEAVHLRKEFSADKGWNDDNVFGLVNWLISYITQIPKESYCQFACTIDMNAYRRLEAESYQLESPVDICNAYCVHAVMSWYRSIYRGGLDYEARYYFDQGEPFEPVFKARWEREVERDKLTGTYGVWSHIKHVGNLNMRTAPGLQIADMLAWGRNREENKTPRYEHVALALTRLAPSLWITWDEVLLRQKYSPLIY